ncbi:40S ribosomal protein S29 [Iris pallida]|uniref:40S ribosomal protein S29 n=1 Tax=Iris pallida TaxID=29817 RepID=A0AAX6HTL7_IRIPA|nr:40S ribosomal protein S29 [Iris pallida]
MVKSPISGFMLLQKFLLLNGGPSDNDLRFQCVLASGFCAVTSYRYMLLVASCGRVAECRRCGRCLDIPVSMVRLTWFYMAALLLQFYYAL